jgi:hypothetical protein
MKIDELVGYKNKPEYQATKSTSFISDLQKKLQDLGYKKYELGSGIFGVTYARPGENFILKVYQTDRGYDSFLKFIKDHAGSPFVPKLKGKPIHLPNNFTIVRMERLEEMSMDAYMAINHFLYSTSPIIRKVSTTELDTHFPGFTDFLLELKADAAQKNMALDMHMGNIMMRGNTPVVIDPYIEK